MIAPLIAAAAIGGGASLIGGLMSSKGQSKGAKAQAESNQRMIELGLAVDRQRRAPYDAVLRPLSQHFAGMNFNNLLGLGSGPADRLNSILAESNADRMRRIIGGLGGVANQYLAATDPAARLEQGRIFGGLEAELGRSGNRVGSSVLRAKQEAGNQLSADRLANVAQMAPNLLQGLLANEGLGLSAAGQGLGAQQNLLNLIAGFSTTQPTSAVIPFNPSAGAAAGAGLQGLGQVIGGAGQLGSTVYYMNALNNLQSQGQGGATNG